tara:strand:- start:1575 stop:2507 length:933 start_codon:yes stop_codon:yes gene_type:complete
MKKILVIKHGALGDIVFAFNAISSIKKNFSKSKIDLLTEKKYIPLFSKSGYFNLIHQDNRKNYFYKSLILIFKLVREKYDLIIDLQNSQRTSIYNFIFRFFSKSIICSSRPFAQLRYFIPRQGKETTSEGLANQLKLLKIQPDFSINYNWLKIKLNNEIKKPLILMIPGVSPGNENKQWQPNKFAEVAKYFEEKKFNICVIGTKLDLKSSKPIFENCKKAINKINTSPPEVIYSIALMSKLIISNDTGPGHIASLSKNHIIWIVNDNKLTQANIHVNKNNHKISAKSLKNISASQIIQYIKKEKLLDGID